jgi:Transposase and inactivated derivatives
MANTYSQIYLHCVFATKPYSVSYIKENQKDTVEKYITGIITNNRCKLIAIYCNPDHTHILFGMKPTTCIPQLIQSIKGSSSKFIHDHYKNIHFGWQDGYGIFSCSPSAIDRVAKYILRQKEHHAKKRLKDEYRSMLTQAKINYDEKYIFDFE